MIAFILAGTALVVVALALLLRPWWRQNRRVASADSQARLNVAIHRDRLAELERDHRNGMLSARGLVEAREELQRQLLEDTAAGEATVEGSGDKRSGIAIALLLPLLAVGLYLLLGAPAALLPEAERSQRASADMEQLTVRLAQKLEQNPDNPEGWAMLARSYKSLGRWDDAEKAFAGIGPTLDRNAELLAEYAEMLVQRDNGFNQRARELTRKALQIEPRNMLALFLGGGEAFDGGRYAEAISLWERLLPQLEAGGEDARMVEASIARARQAGDGKLLAAAPPQDEVHRAAAAKTQGPTAAAKAAVGGRVELAPALKGKADAQDVVFIFARAVDGPRMPLAALRAKVADLPLDFTLDDSQALSAESKISSASLLRVEVRVSKSGNAMPGPGDLTGKSAPVKPGAKGLRIVVDQISP
ncbi:MAG: c-type cytochrome biogenesis protein CcmI [Rhodocyclales bacterium]|nr:c-type cytochrome biogenesis protein CcmI [Rhodocyclales bacterium]